MAKNDQFTTFNRLAPQSLEAERAVLGAILMEATLYASAAEILTPDDFYLEAHRLMFRAMGKVGTPGAIDMVTMVAALGGKQGVEKAGGKSYISSLVDGLPRYSNIDEYAVIVKKHAMRRRGISEGTRLINACYAGEEEAEDLLIKAARRIECITDDGLREEIEEPSRIWEIRHKMENDEDTKKHLVPTGMPFDTLAGEGALAPGELMVVAAPPGGGKTSFMLNIAAFVSTHIRKKVHIESFEMTGLELMDRLIQIRFNLTKRDARAAAKSDFFLKYSAELDDRVFISAPENSDFDRMISRVRKQHRVEGFNLLCVDHLGLMHREGNYQRHDLMVGSMTRTLKMLAKELQIPIILLSQLNRSANREGRVPELYDLRDSGNIEQDANHVVFLWSNTLMNPNKREAKPSDSEDYKKTRGKPPELDDYQMYLAKCRNGRTRIMPMTYALVTQQMRWSGMDSYDFRMMEPTKLADMAAGEQASLTEDEL